MKAYIIFLVILLIVWYGYLKISAYYDYLERVDRINHLPKIKDPAQDPFLKSIRDHQIYCESVVNDVIFNFYKEKKDESEKTEDIEFIDMESNEQKLKEYYEACRKKQKERANYYFLALLTIQDQPKTPDTTEAT